MFMDKLKLFQIILMQILDVIQTNFNINGEIANMLTSNRLLELI